MSILVDGLKIAIANINTALKSLAGVVATKATIDDSATNSTTAYSGAKVESRLAEEVADLNTRIDSATSIDDAAASTTKTYSSDKVEALVLAEATARGNEDTAIRQLITDETAARTTAVAEVGTKLDALIDDATASATTVYSSTKVESIKTAIETNMADELAALQTTLEDEIAAINTSVGGVINDSAVALATTYSSDKIVALLAAAKAEVQEAILGGASAAYDTLKELQTEIEADDTQIANILTLISGLQTSVSKSFANLGAIIDTAALDALLTVGYGYLAAPVAFGTTGITAVGTVEVLPYSETGLVYQRVTTPTAVLVRQETANGPVWGEWYVAGGTVEVMQGVLNLGDTAFDFAEYWDSLNA